MILTLLLQISSVERPDMRSWFLLFVFVVFVVFFFVVFFVFFFVFFFSLYF